jgi:hypothetical protein
MSVTRIDVRVTGASVTGASVTGASGAGDAGWDVQVAQGPAVLGAHRMRALESGHPAPADGGLSAQELADAIEALRTDTATEAAIHPLGEHLFRALVGPAWPAIEAATTEHAVLELALAPDAVCWSRKPIDEVVPIAHFGTQIFAWRAELALSTEMFLPSSETVSRPPFPE